VVRDGRYRGVGRRRVLIVEGVLLPSLELLCIGVEVGPARLAGRPVRL
jgi:hypothetical protein